ncbi:hypothetical protein A7C99_0472 [Trichophyton rubrum]|uniref:PI-PLC Y-box domain-containing protein n=1 Tax=Trichophyton rubrum TaxID=5551 RepID=A0A178F805_TRIRU|nr:hypothetical protein A7C99_0472 [Trichophyton rubrum]
MPANSNPKTWGLKRWTNGDSAAKRQPQFVFGSSLGDYVGSPAFPSLSRTPLLPGTRMEHSTLGRRSPRADRPENTELRPQPSWWTGIEIIILIPTFVRGKLERPRYRAN